MDLEATNVEELDGDDSAVDLDEREPASDSGSGSGSGVAAGVDDGGSDAAGGPPALDERARLNARLALGAFVAYLVAAFFLCLFKFGDGWWFASDEWGLIAGRRLGDIQGLFEPQNEHWSTVPILTYQVLYKIFGLHTYLPYMALTVILHLCLAALLRIFMRRAGVSPWVATIVAGSFVLFGTGYENILFGIQVSMVGSMVFGLTHLLLADHDGPFDRRDALGLAAGLLGLMSSGIGPPLVIVVGIGVLIRRGWRLALCHTAPLAVIYGVWYLWQKSVSDTGTMSGASLGAIVRWMRIGESGVFLALGQYVGVAIALGVLLVVGLVLAWSRMSLGELRKRAAAPVAMGLGALVLFALVSTQRAVVEVFLGPSVIRSSRYLAMATALTLPLLAVAASAVIHRWRYTAPVVLALFVIGVPGNVRLFNRDDLPFGPKFFAKQRTFVLGSAYSPVAKEVPRDVYPDPDEFGPDQVTVGFLLDGVAAGRIPKPPHLSTADTANIAVRLSMAQSRLGMPIPASTCQTYDHPIVITPKEGDQFTLTSRVGLALEVEPGKFAPPSIYSTYFRGSTVTAVRPDLKLQVSAVAPATTFDWCPAD